MFRFLLLLAALGAAFLWLEPRWLRDERTLVVRVRRTDEVVALGRERSAGLAGWLAEEARERASNGRAEIPSVSAPPPGAESGAGSERVTRDEQRRLDELIQERAREP